MTDEPCLREGEVLRACVSAEWTADVQSHLSTCPGCREVRAVTLALRAAAAAENQQDALPEPGEIWWRARWETERDARQRAMRPLDTLDRAEPLVALAVVVVILALGGDRLAEGLFRWAAGDAAAPLGHAMQVLMPGPLMPLLLVGAGLFGLVLLVGLGSVLARD